MAKKIKKGKFRSKRKYKVPKEDWQLYHSMLHKLFKDGEELWYPYEAEPPEPTVQEKQSLKKYTMMNVIYGEE